MLHLPLFPAEHPKLEIDTILDDRIIHLLVRGIDASQMGTANNRSVDGLPFRPYGKRQGRSVR